MNGKWYEIFKVGTWVDASGKKRHYTRADLDLFVSQYNPADHEAPLVIGHPKTDDPAWGWAEDLKREGDLLFAKAQNVVPEFADMVKRGLFKKRSIAHYPDMRLKHIGFLGAVPPAVKGLTDIAFEDRADIRVVEFNESEIVDTFYLRRLWRSMRDWLIEEKGLDVADAVLPSWEVDNVVMDRPNGMRFLERQTEEDDMDRIKELEAKIEELTGQVAEYREKLEEKESQLTEREKEAEAKAQAARESEFAAFCDTLVETGKLLPAQKEVACALFTQLPQGEIEFAEGKKQATDAALRDFLEGLPKQIEFGEQATGGEGGDETTEFVYSDPVDEDRLQIHKKALALQKSKEITYNEAVREVLAG